MATVFLAEDVKHGRRVAIKVLDPEVAAAIGPERFLREIATVARLTHPHILPLHDSGVTDGLLFYVMPYVEGESLRERLTREKQLPVDDALRIAREVADALSYAHSRGVVHRDVKPENILLETGHAVVADFGVARVMAAVSAEKLTATGIAVGTPLYMSPEQAAGSRDVDGRSDLYSLGCVLYEMLAGQPPFVGPTAESLAHQHLNLTPRPVTELRPMVPAAVAAAVQRALAKTPADRFNPVALFGEALGSAAAATWIPPAPPAPGPVAVAPAAESERRATPQEPARAAAPSKRRGRLLVAWVLALAALIAIGFVLSRAGRVAWARSRGIPALEASVAASDWETAYRLARRLEAIVPGDSVVASLRRVFADTMRIEGTPAGARVFRKAYAAGPEGWTFIGTAPIAHILLPRVPAVSQFRFEAGGYATGFDIGAAAANTTPGASVLRFALVPAADLPAGMVHVTGGTVHPNNARLGPADTAYVRDFFLDRCEVTNRQYQVFVDSGGYRRRDLWEHEFVDGSRRLTWDEAMARLVDQTGRAGPATWEAGLYPRGQEDYPVSGVSWYEAAAYAKFRGKRLPSVFEWWRVARFDIGAGVITSASNIQHVREGTAPVGSFGGMSGFGAMDMAGNVREWCFNESRSAGGRYILGGGWTDAAYTFFELAIHSPFDRSPTNGIRLVLPLPGRGTDQAAFRPVEPLFRDYRVERPVSDQAFGFYRRLFTYDPTPLHVRAERRDSTPQWIRERVSYDAAYGNERVTAHVFLPTHGRPPYQTVVFFPGANALTNRSSETMSTGYFDFLVEAGRAVIYPVYRGTFERGDGTSVSDPDLSNAYREHVVMWQKDVSRTLDYLATRSDIDTARIAYMGVSWGGRFGGVVLATEPRFKAAVLCVAGLNFRRAQPEVDDLNYLPRVHTPVLMINGRHDFTFPLETAAKPMFDLLGTSADRKRNVVVDGVHYVPRHDLIRETLGWLDRNLGPVR